MRSQTKNLSDKDVDVTYQYFLYRFIVNVYVATLCQYFCSLKGVNNIILQPVGVIHMYTNMWDFNLLRDVDVVTFDKMCYV